MSAGAFSRTLYATDDNNNVPIRVQPETLALTVGTSAGSANVAPSGTAASGFPSASVSGSRRSIGIHPRIVTIVFTGPPPTGYLAGSTYRIPILQKSLWDGASPGSAAQYLGVAAEVVSKSPEVIR